MPQPDRCPDCGFERVTSGPCPRCLIRLGVDGPGLTLSFPGDLGATLPLSQDPDGTTVLAEIAATIGPVPRVLLRDSETGEGSSPLVRSSSASMPPAGERPGGLQIFGEIARGGMGAVLKARDPDLGRELAVKVLLETHRDDPDLVRRFVEEAQIAGQLQHPGIVPVYDLGTFADHRPYFSMKLIKGRTLAELLSGRAENDREVPRFLAIFEHVCQTMAYAHSRGVIHRDLKPSNIMVGSFGEVQVMDWGLAKVLPRGGAVADASAGLVDDPAPDTIIATARSATDEASLAGSVLGTPSYMAPEQARGENDALDERADVFALGSILCEIVTGRPAFVGRTPGEIQRKAAMGDLAEASACLAASGADTVVVTLALACLAREPWDRPAHAGIVSDWVAAHLARVQERLRATELDRAAESARAAEAVLTARAAEARAVAERRARRMTAALAASLLGLIALGAGGLAWSERQRAARVARDSSVVVEALEEASRIAASARSAPPLSGLWVQAEAAARRADEVARRGESDDSARRRAARLVAEIGRERADADAKFEAEEADRRLVERLAEVRTRFVDEGSGLSADLAYADAFREAALDPDRQPEEAGRAIGGRPRAVAEALASALDDWASLRRKAHGVEFRPATPLARAATIADPDPWRVSLRSALERPEEGQIRAELRRLAEPARLDALGPVSLDLLGRSLWTNAELNAAVATLRESQRRYPGDLWINYDLGTSLQRTGKASEAIRYLAAARALRPATGFSLARVLHGAGETDEAIAVLGEMVRSRPDSGLYSSYLAKLLIERRRWAEGNQALDAAIAASREAVRLRPSDVAAWTRLGLALDRRGKPDEAEAAIRESIRARPGVSTPYHALARHLMTRPGRLAEAEAPIKEAIRLFPGMNWQQLDLASILRGLGRTAEAEAAYRAAIDLQKNSALCHFELAEFLRSQARPEEALESFRRASRETDAYRTDKARIAESIRRLERQLTLAPRLPAILSAEDRSSGGGTAADALDLAELCRDRGRPAAAARFFAEALALDPKLADDIVARARYEAARSSGAAGCGEGQDDPKPDESARAGLRAQALGWLREELRGWSELASSNDPKARVKAHEALARWIIDPKLAGVRGAAAIASLPEGERPPWRALWSDIEANFLQTAIAMP